MNTAEEERYVFLHIASANLNTALRSLSFASSDYPPFVQYCILRDAAVTYCRSFTNTRGVIRKSLKLSRSFVPKEHHKLHDQILSYRKRAYAHADLAANSPKLIRLGSTPSELIIHYKPFEREPLHFKRRHLEALFKAVYERVQDEIAMIKTRLCM